MHKQSVYVLVTFMGACGTHNLGKDFPLQIQASMKALSNNNMKLHNSSSLATQTLTSLLYPELLQFVS